MRLTQHQVQHNTLKKHCKKALKLVKIVDITTQYNIIYVIVKQIER